MPLRIDFVSDVVCPWCAIGLKSLEHALARLDGEVAAQIRFRPFQLNPDLPPAGEDIVSYLGAKYGLSREEIARNGEAIRARGAALGFEFRMDLRDRTYNTFDAHRLLHWAGIEGRQAELTHALFSAYFTRGENVSSHKVLVGAAVEAGLPAGQARTVLASDEYAAPVRAEMRFYMDNGIQGVPAVIINERYMISGGQPPEVFENALRQIAGAGRDGRPAR